MVPEASVSPRSPREQSCLLPANSLTGQNSREESATSPRRVCHDPLLGNLGSFVLFRATVYLHLCQVLKQGVFALGAGSGAGRQSPLCGAWTLHLIRKFTPTKCKALLSLQLPCDCNPYHCPARLGLLNIRVLLKLNNHAPEAASTLQMCLATPFADSHQALGQQIPCSPLYARPALAPQHTALL